MQENKELLDRASSKLDKYSEILMEKNKRMAPIQRRIEKWEVRRNEVTKELDSQLEEMRAEIKNLVLQAGETARGDYHMAVFSECTVADISLLKGLALAFPAINQALRPDKRVAIRELVRHD